jgi:molybdenum cofactor cytidylyltransferase
VARPFVSGLVLGAGGSARLGQPKQLLPFEGTTLLGWVVAQAEGAAALDEVIVVLGRAAEEIRSRVAFGRAMVVENPVFGEGCSSSYRAGIGALDPRAEAVMVLLGDQPGVDRAIIERVAEDWRKDGGRIVLASYRGKRGHPMLFARDLFDALVGLRGDKAAWKILDAHPEWVREVPVDCALPADVDTWADYESARAAAEGGR